MVRFFLRIERLLEPISRYAGWASLAAMGAMVALVFSNMAARYTIGLGTIWLQELEWYILAFCVMTGIAYAMRTDDHVRIDIFTHRMARVRKHWLDLATLTIVAVPVAVLIVYNAWPYMVTSFERGETSPNRGGLPALWIPKGFIVVGFGLVTIEAVRQIIRTVVRLRLCYGLRSRRGRGGQHRAT